jgi:hypothetical protein
VPELPGGTTTVVFFSGGAGLLLLMQPLAKQLATTNAPMTFMSNSTA